MPLAPHIAAWGRRWPGSAFGLAPSTAAGSAPVIGVPFLTDEFGLQARLAVRFAWGADLAVEPQMWSWHDESAKVRYADGGRVSISPMGRSDESSAAQPAGCAFELDNDTGDYTAYATGAKRYPYVRRNTPVQVLINLTGEPGDWIIRFQGYATGFTPSWDQSANVAVVSVAAQGVTRRLSQGTTPLKSALSRAILATNPDFFWPLDDDSEATSAGSGLSGGFPMQFTSGIEFGGYTDLGGMARAVNVVDGSLRADMAGTAALGHADCTWSVEFTMKYTRPLSISNPESDFPLLRFNVGGTVKYVDIKPATADIDPPFLYVTVAFSDNTAATSGFAYPDPPANISEAAYVNERWHNYQLIFTYTAATDTIRLYSSIDGQTVLHTSSFSTPVGATAGGVKSVDVNREQFDWGVFGISGIRYHEGVSVTSNGGTAYNGHLGESPVDRLIRLCAEERIPVDVIGASDTAMGPQNPATFMTLVRACETAEQGVLCDGLGPGLTFVTRAERYNLSASLSINAAAEPPQLGYPFAPVDDDQRNVNVVRAERVNGSFAIVEKADGPLGTDAIQIYDSSISVNVSTDEVLPDYAGWLVHLGTTEGFRFPTLKLDLRASPTIAAAWLQCRVSSRIDVTSVSSVATQLENADVRLLLEGWGEDLSPIDWDVQASMSLYDPWQVGVLDTDGFLDCGACTLATSINATTTSIPVRIADTCVWVHSDGDYGIFIDGEEMTVTAVSAAAGSGSSWTQTLTVTRAVNGVSQTHSPGVEVHVSEPFLLSI